MNNNEEIQGIVICISPGNTSDVTDLYIRVYKKSCKYQSDVKMC